MKNLYIKAIESKIQYLVVLLVFLLGTTIKTNAQVRVNFAQRTSQYTPSKKIYNVKGDFTMLGNTCLTPQNYGDNTNNNGQYMTYVDTDGDPNTFNSSSATLALSTENGAIPSCSNIVYAGLYWTGKSSSNNTFNVTRQVPNGTESINNNLTATHNQNITNTNYSLSITRNNPNPSGTNTSPVFTFSGNGNTYVFSYTNNAAPAKVTLSVNGGTAVNVPVTIVTSGSTATATLTTPYTIVDGTVTIKINSLVRSTAINLSTTDTRNSSSALVNVSGTIQSFTTITKNYDKRVISLKGPNSSSYTKFTASASDIYYPTGGADDNIFSAYKEITDYVRTNGIGEYFAADMALLEGNVSGTGYSGGWGIIVVYENAKMKYRDVTIFDGYAYVQASNSSGFTLPVSGFNTVQAGNVGVKLGLMASEGDVAFTGDYFQIQKNSDASYLNLSHSGNSSTNFFNSSINTGGAFRNPSLQNNTGIDISMFNVPNPSNSVIGNNQTSTNFKYGTSGDTYSIFAIAMAVDAYIPEVEGVISATSINNVPVTSQPYTSLPGQEIALNIDVKNLGTEAINNYKLIVPIPYNATYVTGSAVGTVLFSPLPTPNNVYFDASLGATGSIVWDFGKLPLPVNPSTLLGKLSFKIKATLDCQILSNSSCGSKIVIDGTSNGVGATTGITFSGTKVIQGYTQNGTCIGQPISESINVGINGADYVATNCQNAPLVRNFSYCNGTNVVSPTEISSNFPVGTLFYDSFPVTMNSIQYTVNNPFPLTDGSSITYFAVPPGNSGCNFPFTIAKCKKIIANDDTGTSINGLIGGTSFSNVLVNDTLNGILVTPSQVSLSFVSSTNPGVKLNGSNVVVDPGTPEGSYTLTYQICEVGNLTNCDTAIVTVTVTKSVIIAQDDIIAGGNGLNGNTNAGNVLSNNGNGADTLNGNPVAINQVNLTVTTPAAPINGGFVPVIDVTTGQISIPAGTPAGNYTIDYQICEKLNPTNCDPAIVYITVSAPAIIAQDDIIAGGNGLNGNTNAGNVLSNNGNGADTLNGNPVAINQVNLTVTTPATPINGGFVPVIDVTTGQISIPAGTPAGNYTIDYQICEKLNPTNCDPAIVYITVSAPAIIAQDDIIAGGNGLNGNTNAGNVLSNNGNGADTLNGNPVAINQVNLTVTTPATPINGGFVPVIDVTTGQISIPAGTPAGNYTIDYQICEKLNPTNCDPAIVYITVSAPAIIAQDDIIAGGNGLNGNTNAGNVLSNNGNGADTLNGNPVAINQVNLTVTTPATPINGGFVPVIDVTTGQISIPAGTPAGNYTIVYQICEKLNPTNCDPAIVYITVSAPAIVAVDNDFSIECSSSSTLGNVLQNDLLNGSAFSSDKVNISLISGGNANINLDTTTGDISVINNGLTVGQYTLEYQICEKLNPANCSTANITITVNDLTAPVIPTLVDVKGECSATVIVPTTSDNCAGIITATTSDPLFYTAQGTYVVNWTFDDGNGNVVTTTQNVIVDNTTKPVLPILTDVIGQCSATVTAPTFNNVCSDAVITATTNDPLTYTSQGTFVVTWTFDDGDGNVQTATQNVIVKDVTAPVVPTLADATGECSVSVTAPSTSDNCSGTITATTNDPLSYTAQGTYVVTWTFDDGNGNTSIATQNVIVKDVTAPVVPTLADATGECSASVTAPTTSDNCSGTITATTNDPLSYTAQGTYVVTWTFDDGNGNTSVATQNVIVKDVTAPVVPTLADATGECSASVTAPSTSDNCSGTITATTNDPLSYSAQGTYVVTWTFDDGNGNTSVATQNVIVKDVTAPTLPQLSDVTGQCTATAIAPTTSDNCSGTVTATTTDPLTYSSQGTFVINWTFDDGNGNVVTAKQNVIVDNTTKPVLPTLADITGQCTATATAPSFTNECSGVVITATTTDPLNYTSQGTFVINWTFDDGDGNVQIATQNVIVKDVTAPVAPTLADVTGECEASVTAPTAQDNCAGTITATTTDALSYNTQGTHVVTWTFSDGNGNSSTATQNVIVKDVTAPVAPTLADVTGECEASVTAPTTSDNCAGTITASTNDPLSYTSQGTYVVTWTFDDGNGNTSVATQNVIVKDVTAPTLPQLSDVTGQCTATAIAPTTSDNCSGTVTATTTDPLTYSSQGTFVINWTFDDGNGNVVTAKQNVIVDNTTKPVLPTLADITGQCTATATAPSFTNECSGVVITATTTDPLNYTSQGTFVINWTFDDGDGNVQIATQNVIVKDTEAPIAPNLANITGECEASVTAPSTSDNCSGTITATTNDPLSYSAQGTYVVTWTFDDGNGNTSVATQNVIVKDVTAPVVPSLADATGECSASVTAPSTSDNCSGTITATTNDPLSYSAQGTYVVTWTFDDGNGNTSVATQNVIVKDVTAPVVPSLADATGECSASVTAPSTSDNCSGTITATTNDPLSYSAQGTYVVTWTFDDGNGNTSVATQNVIVKDVTAPTLPQLSDVTGQCTATAIAPTTSDNCSGTVTATTTDPLTYSSQGTFVINWTFDDGNGNVVTAKQNVIVDNTTKPVLPTLADITGQCTATATAPSFTNECSGVVITATTTDPLNYTSQGTFVINWTFDDGDGNVQIATQNVIVKDTEAPIAPNLANITGECEASVTVPTAPDNCAGIIIGTTNDPLSYNSQGTFVITWTFNDGNGNSSSTTQNVIIQNTTPPPAVACYQTATFNPTTCAYDITGTQPEAPVVACYQTATFNPTTCAYDITGTQPEAPVVACYQTATFNPTTCVYDITGTQPEAPVVACYQTATFNPTTCAYDITGTQPEAPVVACYQTATFNPTTCAYDITGTQPEPPVVACYQTATFNPTTCAYDITGTQPEAPVVACYQTATFNPTTCAYDITGTQPEAPVVACYQTATFNPTTCAYDITGTQPEAPVVACYQTATFNPTTCAYDITGTQPEAPVVACYQTATFNPTTCAYDITGTQPEAPVVACYQTATFNPTTCAYDITGTQPEAPVVACYQTATFNPTTCAYDITGTQPEAPVVACYQTATFNPTTCAYDITGTQPEAPVVACYQTATFNPTTCAYDITGTQPEAPVVACYQTATFNPTTCAYDITGTQPEAPVVACYQTATFNPTTCAYDITGTQPEAPVVACYQTATFNPTTCAYDITGTQPEAPVVACYQTATFNPTTCAYDITGTQPEAPVVACYQTATFNPTTCAYDITGTQPEAPVVACYQTATFNPTTCAYDITGTQPEAPVVACYQTATFNPTTCAYDITGTQPEAPVVACYQTATFNPTTCAYDITGTQPEAPVVACYQTATFNPTTCAYDITGTQPEIPALADITGQCSVTAPKPTYTIACSGTEIVATTNDPLTYTTQGSYVINWKFDDGKGFVQAVSQNVIVKDTEKPVVPQLEDVIGQCTATATVPSALDNCSGNIKGTTNDPLSYSIKGDYVITWTFEDGNGNSATATQNVIVKDNEAPVAPTAPKNETYACLGDVPVAPTLTAVDNCDGEINVKGEDAIVQGKCANSFVITRTWTFKDSSDNSSETITQTITVEDNLAPVFNELPATSTISCPAKPEFAEATAIDNCGGAFTLTFEDVTTPGTNGSYSVTRTWKAIDSCGNSSTATQTINVEDKTAPVPPVLEDVKGQCSATATAPIAVDSCVGNIVGTTSDPLTYSTQGTFVIRWTFNDGNGNSFTANQNVIVDDTRAPLAPELADITGQCSATATPPTANDGCAGAIVGTTTDPLKYTLEGTYVIRWTFDDGNGNVTSANQNVIVTSVNGTINGTPGYARCNEDIDLYKDPEYPFLKSLLPQGTPTGGTWIDEINPLSIVGEKGEEKFNPYLINTGNYDLKYLTTDGTCSSTVKITITVDNKCIVAPECNFLVHNAFSPNNDGTNEVFYIENIERTDCFPTNKVEIYNRWGVLVYETNQYDNNSRVFRGISEGRATVNKSAELPTGTYFYIIEYTNDKGDTLKKDGYLYLTR